MESVIDLLKRRAQLLHRAATRGDRIALGRLRKLPALKARAEPSLGEVVQRRHCLSVLAHELGLHGWSHLTKLCTQPGADDFGALLYPGSCGGHWNIWCVDYEEARRIRHEHGGYLLCYRRQLRIVDRHFVQDLGIDADDQDWARIGRDWARPLDLAARHRLLQAVLHARLASTAQGA